MKRRGFLAALGLSPVVAPTMLKDLAAQTAADLNLAPLGLIAEPDMRAPQPWVPSREDALKTIAKMAMRTAAEHDFYRRRTAVYALDPDLASYRSMSLSARMGMQRARNYASQLEGETAWLNGVIAGWIS